MLPLRLSPGKSLPARFAVGLFRRPEPCHHGRGEFTLPWVYLHALKDYTDMAAHLERHPRVRAVVIAAKGPAYSSGHNLKELTARRTVCSRNTARANGARVKNESGWLTFTS